MLETSARLLRLLSLLQTRRDWTGAELAERLEVSGRTVRTDIDRLRRLGYPVDARQGVAGGRGLPGPTAVVDRLFRGPGALRGWRVDREVDRAVAVRRLPS
jgi:biotin operon repressor